MTKCLGKTCINSTLKESDLRYELNWTEQYGGA